MLDYDPPASAKGMPFHTTEATPVPQPDANNAFLLAACAAGDQEAWNRLVERYENLVFSVALRAGLDGDEADDVFQQVWIELHRSLDRIRSPEALPRWLIVSTRRLCYKQVLRTGRRAAMVSADLLDPRSLPDEEVQALEERRRLETAMTRLDAACADLLRLLFHADEARPSYKDISRRTGLAVGSIGPIRARCLDRLRKLMEDVP